ncbi:MAG: hypothetical protein ACLFRG_15570 [Desulfococcaceae bacterium]
MHMKESITLLRALVSWFSDVAAVYWEVTERTADSNDSAERRRIKDGLGRPGFVESLKWRWRFVGKDENVRKPLCFPNLARPLIVFKAAEFPNKAAPEQKGFGVQRSGHDHRIRPNDDHGRRTEIIIHEGGG